MDPGAARVRGWFSRDYEPVASVDPGEPFVFAARNARWKWDADDETERPGGAGHALEGPFEVRGARAGQTLVVPLTAKEYLLLQLLASHPGIVFTRDTLLERVWHFEYPGATTRTVDVHVNSLRKKMEIDPSRPQYIQTVRGVGYRFAE